MSELTTFENREGKKYWVRQKYIGRENQID